LMGSIALLRGLSAWQPVPRYPIYVPVNPDAHVYGVALLLALASGFLFGAVPVRQVLRTNPYEVVKAGSNARAGRRLTARDLLLLVQISICAVLVTSSLVAVRGMVRSLHSSFGFDVQNSLLADTDLSMAGYTGDKVAPMQRRMFDAVAAIPGVSAVGLSSTVPLGDSPGDTNVFAGNTSDLRPSNAVADALIYDISPGYFHADGTAMLSGRAFTWQDDKSAPRVAVVNREFARELFGSVEKAIGGSYKMPDGVRIQVVGVAEDGKYTSITEQPQLVMFVPILQAPSRQTWMVVRSSRDPQALGATVRSTLQQVDPALPVYIRTRYTELDTTLFAPRIATISLGVLGMLGAMLAVTGIFGMAAYSVSKRMRELGIRMALGAQRRELLRSALARPLRLLALGSTAGLLLGLLASRVLAYIVYQATPRDPLVLAGVVFAMLLLGLLATWIPAQRALSVNPLILLREE
jgi:predicted permease